MFGECLHVMLCCRTLMLPAGSVRLHKPGGDLSWLHTPISSRALLTAARQDCCHQRVCWRWSGGRAVCTLTLHWSPCRGHHGPLCCQHV